MRGITAGSPAYDAGVLTLNYKGVGARRGEGAGSRGVQQDVGDGLDDILLPAGDFGDVKERDERFVTAKPLFLSIGET